MNLRRQKQLNWEQIVKVTHNRPAKSEYCLQPYSFDLTFTYQLPFSVFGIIDMFLEDS